MTISSSGPVSFLNLAQEFGGNAPVRLNQYYAGFTNLVYPGSGNLGNIPQAGLISLNHFRGYARDLPQNKYVGSSANQKLGDSDLHMSEDLAKFSTNSMLFDRNGSVITRLRQETAGSLNCVSEDGNYYVQSSPNSVSNPTISVYVRFGSSWLLQQQWTEPAVNGNATHIVSLAINADGTQVAYSLDEGQVLYYDNGPQPTGYQYVYGPSGRIKIYKRQASTWTEQTPLVSTVLVRTSPIAPAQFASYTVYRTTLPGAIAMNSVGDQIACAVGAKSYYYNATQTRFENAVGPTYDQIVLFSRDSTGNWTRGISETMFNNQVPIPGLGQGSRVSVSKSGIISASATPATTAFTNTCFNPVYQEVLSPNVLDAALNTVYYSSIWTVTSANNTLSYPVSSSPQFNLNGNGYQPLPTVAGTNVTITNGIVTYSGLTTAVNDTIQFSLVSGSSYGSKVTLRTGSPSLRAWSITTASSAAAVGSKLEPITTELLINKASDSIMADLFGSSTAISGDGLYTATGAVGDVSPTGVASGSVYIYYLDVNAVNHIGTWTQQQIIYPEDGKGGDLFGTTVWLNSDGTFLAVGAPGVGNNGILGVGALYTYRRTGSVWAPSVV